MINLAGSYRAIFMLESVAVNNSQSRIFPLTRTAMNSDACTHPDSIFPSLTFGEPTSLPLFAPTVTNAGERQSGHRGGRSGGRQTLQSGRHTGRRTDPM
ncbi:MAG: hypothetical protein ACJ8G1_20280 [Vitreoscilla sp.]